MCQTSFETFIRFGGTKTFIVNLTKSPRYENKQGSQATEDDVRKWVDDVWSKNYGAAAQTILKTKPYEFSPEGLADIDQQTLRDEAVQAVFGAAELEGFDPTSAGGEQRALAVLFGFLNQALQAAMGIEFYVWTTQHDARVRGGHVERDGKIFRWDDPPEGGHPSQDFGCRCYARPLGIEGYWQRVGEGVEAFTRDIGYWEGSVDHMYLDSKDNVTVGVGTLLPDSESAIALGFRNRATDQLASADEVSAEFDIINAMDGSAERPASDYRPFTQLYLPQADIDRLVGDHMRGDFDDLLRMFPDFGNFPLSVQIALWDMIYNLGPDGLRRKFPSMRQAIEDHDWEEAARQSHRIGPSEERNQHVFDLFMDAAGAP